MHDDAEDKMQRIQNDLEHKKKAHHGAHHEDRHQDKAQNVININITPELLGGCANCNKDHHDEDHKEMEEEQKNTLSNYLNKMIDIQNENDHNNEINYNNQPSDSYTQQPLDSGVYAPLKGQASPEYENSWGNMPAPQPDIQDFDLNNQAAYTNANEWMPATPSQFDINHQNAPPTTAPPQFEEQSQFEEPQPEVQQREMTPFEQSQVP